MPKRSRPNSTYKAFANATRELILLPSIDRTTVLTATPARPSSRGSFPVDPPSSPCHSNMLATASKMVARSACNNLACSSTTGASAHSPGMARPRRSSPNAVPSHTAKSTTSCALKLATPQPTTACSWQVSPPKSTARRSRSSAVPALAAALLAEPAGVALTPFLDDNAESSQACGDALAPLLRNTTAAETTTLLGLLVPLAALAQQYDPADMRYQGWTWLTLPCPSNPYRIKRDEDAMYVLPTFWQCLKAHLEDRTLHGLY